MKNQGLWNSHYRARKQQISFLISFSSCSSCLWK